MNSKNIILISGLVVFLFVAISAPSYAAVDARLAGVVCSEGVCFENNLANWTFVVQNTESTAIKMQNIRVDDIAGIPVASYLFNETVGVNESKVFSIVSRMPAPTRGLSLYVVSCFTIDGREYCERSPTQLTVFELRDMRCLSSEQCALNEACMPADLSKTPVNIVVECRKLECVNNTKAENHTCVPVESVPIFDSSSSTLQLPETGFFTALVIVLIILVIVLIILLAKRPAVSHVSSRR